LDPWEVQAYGEKKSELGTPEISAHNLQGMEHCFELHFAPKTPFISTPREKIEIHPFNYLVRLAFPFLVPFPNPQYPPALFQVYVSHHDR
jgi:hypothetical protein